MVKWSTQSLKHRCSCNCYSCSCDIGCYISSCSDDRCKSCMVFMCMRTGELRGHWVRWDTLVPEFGGLATEMSPLSTVPLVPSVMTVRTEYLVDILARQGNHVMLIGDRGSAKSLIVRHYLTKKNADGHLSKTVVFSSVTTSTTLQVQTYSPASESAAT